MNQNRILMLAARRYRKWRPSGRKTGPPWNCFPRAASSAVTGVAGPPSEETRRRPEELPKRMLPSRFEEPPTVKPAMSHRDCSGAAGDVNLVQFYAARKKEKAAVVGPENWRNHIEILGGQDHDSSVFIVRIHRRFAHHCRRRNKLTWRPRG